MATKSVADQEQIMGFHKNGRGVIFMITVDRKIDKAILLINQMQVSRQNQGVQGDLYEYLLSKLGVSGSNADMQGKFAGVVARASCRACRDIESLWGRMSEGERQVEELFESLLSESFGGL
jgi:hypothetical protein